MSIRMFVMMLAGLVVAMAAAAADADPVGDQVRQVYDKVVPSTVIVTFYIQQEGGERINAHVLGTVITDDNVIMFASAAIPSQVAISQFQDFGIIVNEGDDLAEYKADYLGKDDQAQVAFLKVTDAKAPKLPALVFDEGAEVGVGDAVVSMANLGEPDAFTRVVQVARVAARIEQPVETYLCTSGLGSPGTPVLTLDGKTVGIVGLVRLNQGTNAQPKWSLAQVVWPVERFIERLKNLPKGGKSVRQAWVGVHTLTPITKELAEYFNLGDRRGVVVGQVIEDSPADKAGIKAEDIILAVAGEPISGTEGQLVENFMNNIRQRKVGEKVPLEVWREGKTRTVTLALGPQPASAAEAERYANTQFGLTVREMVVGDRLARELPKDETGVVVAFLKPAGWAADGGLQGGDIIKKVQDQDTPNLATFKKVFQAELKKKPAEVVLFVLRGKKDTHVVRIEARW
ncbi:MAG: PDZ domain-containing protein [Planctomycetes bacterium]|nr:PDZ domain-containing protein [Planctomycetota bacterium]